MGCLFKSFGIIILLVLLLPVILLLSFFGRTRFTSVSRDVHNNDTEKENGHSDREDTPVHPDKPIDQSTVEYIDFEEVKDNDTNK